MVIETMKVLGPWLQAPPDQERSATNATHRGLKYLSLEIKGSEECMSGIISQIACMDYLETLTLDLRAPANVKLDATAAILSLLRGNRIRQLKVNVGLTFDIRHAFEVLQTNSCLKKLVTTMELDDTTEEFVVDVLSNHNSTLQELKVSKGGESDRLHYLLRLHGFGRGEASNPSISRTRLVALLCAVADSAEEAPEGKTLLDPSERHQIPEDP